MSLLKRPSRANADVCESGGPKIPFFEQVSTNPDRPGTEDYIRNHVHESNFYEEVKAPQR